MHIFVMIIISVCFFGRVQFFGFFKLLIMVSGDKINTLVWGVQLFFRKILNVLRGVPNIEAKLKKIFREI